MATDIMFANLKTQFENAMIDIISKIAENEGLDTNELVTKYLSKEAKVKTSRKATVTVKPVDAKCECLTAKGKPCSMKPLDGTTKCRVHTKKAESGAPTPEAPPKKAPKKTKAKKREEPLHTHDLDGDVHADCELCQTHGCPLADDENDDEYETVSSPPRSLRERLTRTAGVEEYLDEEDDD